MNPDGRENVANMTYESPDDIDLSQFWRDGVCVVRGLAKTTGFYASMQAELRMLIGQIMRERAAEILSIDLPGAVIELWKEDPKAPQKLCHLGTQPGKLVSANQMKFSAELVNLARRILGRNAILGTPHAGDTLHMFFPSQDQYILPVHQDYPYFLQSEQQVTFYLPLTDPEPDIGGVRVWPGSHCRGVMPHYRSEEGHLYTVVPENAFPALEIDYRAGDVIVWHGLLAHQGIPNRTEDSVRIVQLFRYSDLSHPSAARMRWYSATYPRPGKTYEEVYADEVCQGHTGRESDNYGF